MSRTPQAKRHRTLALIAAVVLFGTGILAGDGWRTAFADSPSTAGAPTMQLGHFSLSLAVQDLAASRTFYAALGFEPVGGNPEHGWQILRNGDVVIGLFQDKFEGNILTFNPGWDADQNPLDTFQDIRDIQARLKAEGIALLLETDPDGDGIGHIVLQDPDGNQIMFDQHVPRP